MAYIGEKLIRKGYTAYLAHVIDTQMAKSDQGNVPIVREYLDVFLEELSRLPPKREIEFTIEVVLVTTSISQTLYLMALSELKKLKDQLEALMVKDYIRHSTLQWVASVLFVKKKDMH